MAGAGVSIQISAGNLPLGLFPQLPADDRLMVPLNKYKFFFAVVALFLMC